MKLEQWYQLLITVNRILLIFAVMHLITGNPLPIVLAVIFIIAMSVTHSRLVI